MVLKQYKPTSPGQRGLVLVDKSSLSKDRPMKKLTEGLPSKSGRNNNGRITSRRRGGGHKRLYREVDSKRIYGNYSYNIVERIDYDPSKSGFLALLKCLKESKMGNTKKWYILAPSGLKSGDIIKGYKVNSIDENNLISELNINSNQITNLGESKPLKEMILGTNFYNLDGKYIKSAGTSGIVLKHDEELGLSTIKLPSGKITTVKSSLTATIGIVSNIDNYKQKKGKAGVNRWLGIRPTVRGEAMNPVDHPHGGKSHGSGGLGNPAKNKWGKLAKWVKTAS